MMMMCRKESPGRMDKHEVHEIHTHLLHLPPVFSFFFFYSLTELFTDLCLSPGFTIRENPPRAFVCARICVSLFFVPGITGSRRGRES